jgi:hypothetical protein
MTEQLIRDLAAEKERARDNLVMLDRIARGEKEFAVLLTRFEAAVRDGVGKDHLTALKKEMEDHVASTINHVCSHVDARLDRQAEDYDAKLEAKLNASLNRVVRKLDEANKRRADRIIKFGVAFAIILMPLVSGAGPEVGKALFRLWTGLP